MLERLFEAGVDVFRINMSHTPHEAAKKLHATVRAAEVKFKRPIGILADLQGPKFRIGEMAGGRVFVKEGPCSASTASDAAGSAERVLLPHPQIFARRSSAGHTLLLDDGKIRMRVIEASTTASPPRCIVGGALASRKGIAHARIGAAHQSADR